MELALNPGLPVLKQSIPKWIHSFPLNHSCGNTAFVCFYWTPIPLDLCFLGLLTHQFSHSAAMLCAENWWSRKHTPQVPPNSLGSPHQWEAQQSSKKESRWGQWRVQKRLSGKWKRRGHRPGIWGDSCTARGTHKSASQQLKGRNRFLGRPGHRGSHHLEPQSSGWTGDKTSRKRLSSQTSGFKSVAIPSFRLSDNRQ